jgi:signal transduction histidine kinase
MSTDQKRTKKSLNPLPQKGLPSTQDFLKRHALKVNSLLETNDALSFDQIMELLEGTVGQLKQLEGHQPGDEPEPVQAKSRMDREFLFKTFHDMRNPLHAIMGYASLVLRKTRDQIPEKHQENLEKVLQSADRLQELVDQMVAYYREK